MNETSSRHWRTSRLFAGVRDIWPRAGIRGVVFSKLSKLLNQENALSAPCSHSYFCSPQAPSLGAAMLRKGVISHGHISLCYTQVITRTSADTFPVVGGICTGTAPVQGQAGPSWQDGADVWILTATVVRFLVRVELSLVTMAALCFFIIAR